VRAIAEAKSALDGLEPELRPLVAAVREHSQKRFCLLLGRVARAGGAPQRRRLPGRIALTFDDGPTSLTPQYLAVLKQLGVRATFFVIGELCTQRPDLVAAIAAHGHELAGHGYTHRRFTELSKLELTEELERTEALLPPRPSTSRPLVRPPHGSVSVRSMLTCRSRGFTTVLWSFNSDDWCNKDTAQVEETFHERTAAAGEIVLLHEGQSWTMNALPTIVGALEKAGHDLVTVGELLG